jgi:hypothetical protein
MSNLIHAVFFILFSTKNSPSGIRHHYTQHNNIMHIDTQYNDSIMTLRMKRLFVTLIVMTYCIMTFRYEINATLRITILNTMVESYYAEWRFVVCHYAKYRYAKCSYAECYYGECCGAEVTKFQPNESKGQNYKKDVQLSQS